ncbi:MAG: flagellar basal body-associated protein FliL [Glaciecola sp.]|jgi:flagellar basal body-associated protein FliL
MENSVDQKEKKGGKSKIIILIILLGGLTCLSGFLGYKVLNTDKEQPVKQSSSQSARTEKLKNEMEKISSMLETIGFESTPESLKELTVEHLAIREEADKHKKKLLALQEQMKQLMEASGGEASDPESFALAYRKLKASQWELNNQVNKLKKRNKDLLGENEKLSAEKKQLNADLVKQKESTEVLLEERDILRGKVEKAAILNVSDLSADGIRVVRRGREKVSAKAKRVEKLRVGFTLPKNDVANAGLKTVYMVITGPNSQIMTDGGSNFKMGSKNMAYTVKTQVEYTNKTKDLMMYGKPLFKDEFDPGRYKVELYCEGAKIGSTEVSLK